MAWPTTPATTTHLDAGTDDPNLARPQIKQNVENVNAIIDEFGDVAITSPTDGQVLAYNLSNTRWENADASSGGGTATVAIIESTGYKTSESINGVFRNPVTWQENSDLGSIVSIGTSPDDDELTFVSGTYEIQLTRVDRLSTSNAQRVELANITTDSILLSELQADDQWGLNGVFTSNGTDTFKIVYRSSSITGNFTYFFRILKLA